MQASEKKKNILSRLFQLGIHAKEQNCLFGKMLCIPFYC